MTIKQIGGVFGRNPTFNDVETSNLVVENNTSSGTLTVVGDASAKSLTVSGNSAYGNGKIFTTNGEGLMLAAKTGTFFDAALLAAGLTNYAYTVATGTNNIKFWGDTTIGNSTTQNHPVNGNLVMADGNGIDFSATPGTGTSELFDDYEEGTWTPVGNGITLSTATGSYTKIGRVVAYFAEVIFPVQSDGNLALLDGLPFVPINDTDSRGGGNIGFTDYSASTLFGMSQTVSRIDVSDPAGLITNANLSGKTIQFGGTYYVS